LLAAQPAGIRIANEILKMEHAPLELQSCCAMWLFSAFGGMM
jgi:hypothetical protein